MFMHFSGPENTNLRGGAERAHQIGKQLIAIAWSDRFLNQRLLRVVRKLEALPYGDVRCGTKGMNLGNELCSRRGVDRALILRFARLVDFAEGVGPLRASYGVVTVHKDLKLLNALIKLGATLPAHREGGFNNFNTALAEICVSQSNDFLEKGGFLHWLKEEGSWGAEEKRLFANCLLQTSVCAYPAKEGEVELVKSALELGADPKQRYIRADSGTSFLVHTAASYGKVEVLDSLLSAGASPDERNAGGFAAAHVIAIAGHSRGVRDKLLKVLESHGANLNLRANSLTPFGLACKHEKSESAAQILDALFRDSGGKYGDELPSGGDEDRWICLKVLKDAVQLEHRRAMAADLIKFGYTLANAARFIEAWFEDFSERTLSNLFQLLPSLIHLTPTQDVLSLWRRTAGRLNFIRRSSDPSADGQLASVALCLLSHSGDSQLESELLMYLDNLNQVDTIRIGRDSELLARAGIVNYSFHWWTVLCSRGGQPTSKCLAEEFGLERVRPRCLPATSPASGSVGTASFDGHDPGFLLRPGSIDLDYWAWKGRSSVDRELIELDKDTIILLRPQFILVYNPLCKCIAFGNCARFPVSHWFKSPISVCNRNFTVEELCALDADSIQRDFTSFFELGIEEVHRMKSGALNFALMAHESLWQGISAWMCDMRRETYWDTMGQERGGWRSPGFRQMVNFLEGAYRRGHQNYELILQASDRSPWAELMKIPVTVDILLALRALISYKLPAADYERLGFKQFFELGVEKDGELRIGRRD